MDKKSLSERDICTKFITPALRKAGWDEMAQIREEVSFTKGRIIVRGKLVSPARLSSVIVLDTLALPEAVKHWSLTSLRQKLVKIGARIVGHGRYVTFQMAEVAVPRGLFDEILRLIAQLRAPLAPA